MKQTIKSLFILALTFIFILSACSTPTEQSITVKTEVQELVTQEVVMEPTSEPESAIVEEPTTEAEPVTIEESTPEQIATVEKLMLSGGGYWGHPSPFGFNRGPGYTRASLLFDSLVWRDSAGETIPWLATEWQLSEDELTWTFTLRDGVAWHDGQPLTADDVAFSIQYYLDHPGTAWFMAQANEIASVQKVSDNQVAITLKRPYAPFIQTTAESLLIFPKHIWQNVEDPKTYMEADAYIGSGAYKLVEFSQEEGTYLFESNPDFFLGVPYVKEIAFVPVSDDLLALANGDIAAFDKFGGVTDEMLEPFQAAPYVIDKAPGEWGMFLYFNLDQDTALKDIRFRQAIAYAIDFQAILERVLFGFGDAGSPGFLPPANPYYTDQITQYPLDMEKAKSLLAESDYDGSPIRLAYSPDWIMSSPRVVEIIQAAFDELGIVLKLESMDQATIDSVAKEGNYDIILTGFGGLGGDPDQLRRNFAANSANSGFSRAIGYNNPAFNELAEAQVSMTDPAERQAAIDKMQAILAEDLPALALYYTARIVVFNSEVFDNWYFTPGGYAGGIPQPYNKHQFITGLPAGLMIR